MNATTEAARPALSAEQAIGQIAVELPGATAVFRRLKLDFCCGGQLSLRQASADKGLDLQAVMDELSTLQRPSQLPDAGTPGELIDHILTRFHDVHRQQLPELIRMAHRGEAGHRGNPDGPARPGDAEAILSPRRRGGGNSFVSRPVGVMRPEHNAPGAARGPLATLPHDMTPPMGACNTWRALYTGLAQLRDDLIQHIHLENNVLFPPFEAATAGGCGSSGCGCS